MTNAPEKIWANFNGSDTGFGIYPDGYEDGDTVYIRADLVPQWQPIETAPTDYTEVIGMDDRGLIFKTWWFAPSSNTRGWAQCGNHKFKYWNPTQWITIPTPSEKETK